MPLTTGSKLGPYEILAPLGAGGMGEVYRALDPRIGREVAVKVLPPAFAEDSDRLARFEQEARATGSLNHPNILAIYDVGTDSGSPYLVSELLEGETLKEKIRTALPQRKTVDYALQIAKGLAAAHDKGIIHRDLKPENVFVTNDGRVKILDFGLAKLTQVEVNESEVSKLQTGALSRPGMIVGTIGYMSPEQVRGRPSDHRSDIFAFGLILYEMLTGKRAFTGDTPADTMIAILQKEPQDLSESNPALPPAMVQIVQHCLEKNPSERFQSMHDVAFYLTTLSSTSATGITNVARAPEKTRILPSLPWLIAAFSLLLAAFFAYNYYVRRTESQPRIQALITPPQDYSFEPFSDLGIAVSPDGTQLAFAATSKDGKKLLWVRPFNTGEAKALPGTDGASFPFWSPDSRFIAFFADGKLKKISTSGSPPQIICDAPSGRGGSWGPDDTILLAPEVLAEIHRVSATGGTPVPVTKNKQGESRRWPVFLPDGKHFLFIDQMHDEKSGGRIEVQLWVGSFASDEVKLLIQDCSNAFYIRPGYLLYVKDGILLAQGFNLKRMALDGEPIQISKREVRTLVDKGYAGFSSSADGVLCFLQDPSVATRLTWFDRSGNNINSISDEDFYRSPRLSPDGKSVVVTKVGASTPGDIWILDLVRGNGRKLTFLPDQYGAAVWSADGSRLFYQRSDRALHSKPASGAGQEETLVTSGNWKMPGDSSKDGKYLSYLMQDPALDNDIWILPLTGDQKPFLFLQTPYMEWDGEFSPDGKWLAYTSDESGRSEIYVRPFPEGNGKWQVSVSGGVFPRWRGDGKELFYVTPGMDKLMAVVVEATSVFQSKIPQMLFPLSGRGLLAEAEDDTLYDVTPDGQRFLIAMPVREKDPSYVTLVLNWTADLPK